MIWTCGFGINVRYKCVCSKGWIVWKSMPDGGRKGRRPVANVLIAASMSLAGFGYTELYPLQKYFNLQIPDRRVIEIANNEFTYPSLNEKYEENINYVREKLSQYPSRPLTFGHDACLDSPGKIFKK